MLPLICTVAVLLALVSCFLNLFYKGANGVIVFGIVQAIAGYTLYARSDRMRDAVYGYKSGKLKTKLAGSRKSNKLKVIIMQDALC